MGTISSYILNRSLKSLRNPITTPLLRSFAKHSNSEGVFLQQNFSRLVHLETAGLFVALITVGAFIAVPLPISPVPIVLQDFFVLLAGLLLPAGWAALSVLAYLLLGSMGLPVFAGGSGGLAHFAGPSGGYLFSYLFVAPAVGLVSGGTRAPVRLFLATVTGLIVIYTLGVPWLARVLDINIKQGLLIGVLPYLPGDTVKMVLAILVVRGLPENIWRNLHSKTST